MSTLENRVARLESAWANVTLQTLSDAELDAHILTLMDESPGWYDAIIARVMRHPSAFPVVHDDPAHKNINDHPLTGSKVRGSALSTKR